MKPRHDPLPGGSGTAQGKRNAARPFNPGMPKPPFGKGPRGSKRRGKDDTGGEPCPVKPDRPLDLSGGAAAALEFDD